MSLLEDHTVLDHLGITLDSIKMEVRLSEDKAKEVQELLGEWSGQQSCRKRELLSLIGKLAHVCKVVRVDRLFLCRMIVLSTRAKQLDYWIYAGGWCPAQLEQEMHDASGA